MRARSAMWSVACLGALAALPAWSGDTGSVQGSLKLQGRTKGPLVVYIDGEGPAIDGMRKGSIEQVNKRFVPHGLVVAQGAEVDFPNRDNTNHSIYSTAEAAPPFHFDEYRAGDSRSKSFERAGVIEIQCDIHPSMYMEILVLPNAWFQVLEPDARSFSLAGVSPGKHTLRAWTPDHEQVSVEVTVPAGGQVSADLTLRRKPMDELLDADLQPTTEYH